MRKKYRKDDFKDVNKYILITGIIFMVFIIIGSYLNKIWPSSQQNILSNINPVVQYYDSDLGVIDTVISNVKSDLILMTSISVLTLAVVTFPIVLLIFMLKGLSIGYTINSIVLALNLESIKFIIILLTKNIIIIPGIIIITIISIKYLIEVIKELNRKKTNNILFLGKRYLQNAIIAMVITIGTQSVLNIISMGIVKLLAR